MRTESTCSERAVPNKRGVIAITCALLILSAGSAVCAQGSDASVMTAVQASKIPPDQLDSLVAPIALYPDAILAQVLVASTYPLEIVQLQQWLDKNPSLKDQALTDAVMKQPWDPSIQAMAALPDTVKLLADDIQWTADLGNAFLAQQGDVMDAVQRMRKKAQDKGALKSSEQLKVETKVVEEKTVIVVEPANPEVIYVPSYNPVVIWGPPVYPYPPIYYPPYYPGSYWATAAISFGVGVAIGACWGHCGWGCGWGHNDIDIDIDNNFNRNNNINNIRDNRTGDRASNRGGDRAGNKAGNKWQHNPQHRGGAPYSNRATANKYGGTTRGDSLANRQAGARQQVSRQGGNMRSASGPSASNRASGGGYGSRGGSPSVSNRSAGSRGGSPSVSNRSSSRDSIGSRDVSRNSRSKGSSGFGSSSGYNSSRTRSSSSRGYSSMGSRGGGGMRGGGGRGRR